MNNIQSNIIRDIVNKVPPTVFYNELPDRKQVLNIINWLYQNVPESQNVDKQLLFREAIAKHLRVISLKIIEIHILIMVGLNNISLEDFTIDGSQLVNKIINQNKDNNDLDTMYRVVGQIMSKMPRDLRDSITGEQKLSIFQELSKAVNIQPKLLEKFLSLDPSLNTPITMNLDSGDYNTLNRKYSNELKKFEETNQYINSDNLEYSNLKSRLEQLPVSTTTDTSQTPSTTNILKTQYIDMHPNLMVGKDNKLYYYDEGSGVITEMPINEGQTPITTDEMETILKANKVKKEDINNLILELKGIAPKPILPESSTTSGGLFNGVGSFYTNWFGSKVSQIPILQKQQQQPTNTLNPDEVKFQLLDSTYVPEATNINATQTTKAQISGFANMNDTKITQAQLIDNMKKNNKNVENVAIGLVVVFILIFLVVIYNAIRENKKK